VAEVPGQTVRAVTPGQRDKKAIDPVAVQQTLLRFAGEYSMRMTDSVDQLRRGTNALSPAEILQTKIALATETCSIASGPNAVANLLDMTVFVTVMRWRNIGNPRFSANPPGPCLSIPGAPTPKSGGWSARC
jgi:hypothetical protein